MQVNTFKFFVVWINDYHFFIFCRGVYVPGEAPEATTTESPADRRYRGTALSARHTAQASAQVQVPSGLCTRVITFPCLRT